MPKHITESDIIDEDNMSSNSAAKIPTQQSVKAYVDASGGGGGAGGMDSAIYDPQNIADDAFDADNHTDGTTKKVFTATERTKLSGVATGATANDTDANLKNRANHTGTQTASTISDFATAVSTNSAVAANTAHIANTSNPHSVTKAQVGLGSVTNDAQLKTASNLSDLASAATARTNLGVYSITDIDTSLAGKVSKNELMLNVLDFGAVGDGTTDDTSAIQDAIDAGSSTGKWVYFPPLHYGISLMLRLKEDTKLSMYGAVIDKLDIAGDYFMACNFESGDTTTTGYNGHSNIIVEGGTWDTHADTNTNVTLGNTITINHCRNVTFRDVTFLRTAWPHALELNAVHDAWVENCKFLGHYDYTGGTYTNKEMIQLDLANSGSIDSGAEDGTTTKNVTILGCMALPYDGQYGGASLPAPHVLVGSHAGSGSQYFENIRVIGCYTYNTDYAAVRAFRWLNSVISNNVFLSCTGYGVYGQTCINVKSTGNTITVDSGAVKEYFDTNSTGCEFDTGWIALGYGSGFGAQSFGYAPAYRRIGNIVYLRGTTLKASGNITGGVPYGTLPAEVRPTEASYFLTRGGGSVNLSCQVNTDGTISVGSYSGSTTWMSIDNISFSIG